MEFMEKTVSRVGGVELLKAAFGETGITLARDHRPDLIIVDMNMPGLSGNEIADAVRNDPTLADTRIIAVSGSVSQ